MDNKYALQVLRWAMYKFYNHISGGLAVYQLTELDYRLDTQTENIKAIHDFLLYTACQPPKTIRTAPDPVHEDNWNRNPRKGWVFKSTYGYTPMYVEIKHPCRNRSRAQLDYEDQVKAAGSYYLVVDGLVDLVRQINILEVIESAADYDSS